LTAIYDLEHKGGLVPVDELELDFDVFHPQGLAYDRGRFFLATVEVVEPPEKLENGNFTPGKGRGHLLVFNTFGELLEDLPLGRKDRYHPGGISSDGDRLWIPVAEYRPNSFTTVYTMDLKSLKIRRAFEVADHLSVVAADPDRRLLYAYSWDSQERYAFSFTGRLVKKQRVENGWVAYQGAVVLPDGKLLTSGIRKHQVLVEGKLVEARLGGLSVETAAGRLSMTHPVPLLSSRGNLLTRNAFTMVLEEGGPRFYFLPDDGEADLLTYAPRGQTVQLGLEVPSARK
jgi:hypothetical protein